MDDNGQGVRADVWLWAARFFKTRRLCREAIDAGQVKLNGYACKPGKLVQAGDELEVLRSRERFAIQVLAVASKRGPASVAQSLYQEHPQSVAARAKARELNRLAGQQAPNKRPDGRQQRQLRRIKHGQNPI